MNRIQQLELAQAMCMPHVCGDEPITLADGASIGTVCPTYVGMNRGERR